MGWALYWTRSSCSSESLGFGGCFFWSGFDCSLPPPLPSVFPSSFCFGRRSAFWWVITSITPGMRFTLATSMAAIRPLGMVESTIIP